MKKPVTFRFDTELLERARRLAEADHRTLTNYVEIAVLRAVNSNQMSASPGIPVEASVDKGSGNPVS
jgi:predicted transcriptional regulator